MATDTSWGYEGWSSYSWGGQSQDITVYVGVQDGWGRSVWGSGGFGAYVADADLQLSALTGDTQVELPAIISVTGSQANIEIGTLFTKYVVYPLSVHQRISLSDCDVNAEGKASMGHGLGPYYDSYSKSIIKHF
jgi:hypothetical protein